MCTDLTVFADLISFWPREYSAFSRRRPDGGVQDAIMKEKGVAISRVQALIGFLGIRNVLDRHVSQQRPALQRHRLAIASEAAGCI